MNPVDSEPMMSLDKFIEQTGLSAVTLKPAKLPAELVTKESLEIAKKYLTAAKREQPVSAVGYDLLAAKISYGVLEWRPTSSARTFSRGTCA
jgi:hypothetical protein